ncbi:MAG: cytochrome c biogenesis protein CcdA, partial [bacterium]
MKKEILFIILLAVFLCGFVTPARAFVEFYPDSLDFLSGNIFLAAAIVFLLGFSLNLTPCVYPLVPVTVSFFSRRSASTPASRLANGLAFFCGLIIFYTLLGLLASCTGFIFGALFQYSSVRVGLALLMLFLALVMFDLIRFDSPGLLQVLSGFVGEKLGSFGLGLTMGLAAAPCVGPPVVALLTFVAVDGDLLRG